MRAVLMLVVPFATAAFHLPSQHPLPSSTTKFSRQSPTSTTLNPGPIRTTSAAGITELRSKQPSPSDAERKKRQRKGVYARPSAAIERGSGFFVPGLEGSRVRILFGAVVLVLNYVNMSLFGTVSEDKIVALAALGFSGNVSAFFGVLLLIQGSIESVKEMGLGAGSFDAGIPKGKSSGGATSSASDSSGDIDAGKYLEQVISPSLNMGDDAAVAEATSWAAASYVALALPATHVMLLEWDDRREKSDGGAILYSLGKFLSEENKISFEKVQGGIGAAVQTVHESKGGRVSIPATHPASVSLLPEANRRCVLLQKVQVPPDGKGGADRKLCLLVGSDQLLQAYTKNDLRWLGRLGKYLSLRI